MNIVVDKIKNKDIKEAERFCSGIFNELGWNKNFFYGFENLKDFFSGEREIFFLAKDKEKIAACAGLKELSEKEGLLKRFYVAKDFRGSGLAEKMIEKIKNFASRKNYKIIVLDVFLSNKRAQKFFEKQGFEVFSPFPLKSWKESQHPDEFQFRKLNIENQKP